MVWSPPTAISRPPVASNALEPASIWTMALLDIERGACDVPGVDDLRAGKRERFEFGVVRAQLAVNPGERHPARTGLPGGRWYRCRKGYRPRQCPSLGPGRSWAIGRKSTTRRSEAPRWHRWARRDGLAEFHPSCGSRCGHTKALHNGMTGPTAVDIGGSSTMPAVHGGKSIVQWPGAGLLVAARTLNIALLGEREAVRPRPITRRSQSRHRAATGPLYGRLNHGGSHGAGASRHKGAMGIAGRPTCNPEPVERRRYLDVIEEILRMVALTALKPGDRLPNERQLTDRCAVSRSTVREALLALELCGVIEVLPGSGCYLVGAGMAPRFLLGLVGDSSPRELLDVRQMIEPTMAGCAPVMRAPEMSAGSVS